MGDYYDYPSLNEIFLGLMKEATLQVTKDSGCPEGSQMLQEAIDNICATWKQMLDLVTDLDKDKPLDDDILDNPKHPVTQLMLTIYSLETFVYKSLN